MCPFRCHIREDLLPCIATIRSHIQLVCTVKMVMFFTGFLNSYYQVLRYFLNTLSLSANIHSFTNLHWSTLYCRNQKSGKRWWQLTRQLKQNLTELALLQKNLLLYHPYNICSKNEITILEFQIWVCTAMNGYCISAN